MSVITYRLPDGSERTIESSSEISIMRAAVTNGVPGIIAECGGQAMCATCHVYIDDGVPLPHTLSSAEEEMLECVAAPREETSRLGCQVTVPVDAHVTVRIPDAQF